MGKRVFSLYVKLDNPQEFKIDEITKTLLNGELSDQEDRTAGRAENLITVTYTKNGIEFISANLAYGVLWFKNRKIINSFYSYFKKPSTILVFWDSDFDCSAGFSLIRGGKIIRHRYYFPDRNLKLTEDYGIRGEEEKKFFDWLTQEGGVEGDTYDPKTDLMEGKIYPTQQIYYYHYTSGSLLNLVMKKHLGFTIFDYPSDFYKNNFSVKLSKPVYELFDVYMDVNTFKL